MTDYNDGEWHLWDGSFERPEGVHPESLIDQIWHDEHIGQFGMEKDASAKDRAWSNTLKFRVTKPHREPRVIWVNEYPEENMVHSTEERARRLAGGNATRIAVRYVEAPDEP